MDKTQPLFVGIDVHKRTWSVCLIHQEVIIGQMSIPGRFQALSKILERYEGFEICSVYEAGFSGFHLHFNLEKKGVKNIIVSPNKIPTQSGDFVKTDKRDSQKLAYLLSKGMLNGIHIPTPDDLDKRQLLRTREKIKCKKARVISQVKMMLLQFDSDFPVKGLTKAHIEQIRNIKLGPNIKFCIDLHLRELEFLDSQLNELNCEIRTAVRASRHQNKNLLLQTMPGIGPIIATSLCFEVGDWQRFSNAKQFCAYFGITPGEYSSGEKVYRGRITRQGKPWIRGYLVQGAWKTIQTDPNMARYYHRIKNNSGSGKKAIVAVSRKMLCRMFSMVKNNQAYISEQAA